MAGAQPDSVLILCRSAAMVWPTVKAVIKVHPEHAGMSSQGFDTAFAHYERLSAWTAQRVVRFWQVRRSA
jgi:hypothetical protein